VTCATVNPSVVLIRNLTTILAAILSGAKTVLRGSVVLGDRGSYDREKQDHCRRDLQFSHRYQPSSESRPSQASKLYKCLVIRAVVSHVSETVPELTRSADIKLNERVRLPRLGS
jgi:hypothetical protein